MIRVELFFGLVTLALWIYSLVDVISTDEGAMRYLPKPWWLLLVLFFPWAGSVAWLVAGRPLGTVGRGAQARAVPDFPEYDRPGRAVATDPESEAEFLRGVRERAEEQRRAYREQQRRREAPGDEGP